MDKKHQLCTTGTCALAIWCQGSSKSKWNETQLLIKWYCTIVVSPGFIGSSRLPPSLFAIEPFNALQQHSNLNTEDWIHLSLSLSIFLIVSHDYVGIPKIYKNSIAHFSRNHVHHHQDHPLVYDPSGWALHGLWELNGLEVIKQSGIALGATRDISSRCSKLHLHIF